MSPELLDDHQAQKFVGNLTRPAKKKVISLLSTLWAKPGKSVKKLGVYEE